MGDSFANAFSFNLSWHTIPIFRRTKPESKTSLLCGASSRRASRPRTQNRSRSGSTPPASPTLAYATCMNCGNIPNFARAAAGRTSRLRPARSRPFFRPPSPTASNPGWMRYPRPASIPMPSCANSVSMRRRSSVCMPLNRSERKPAEEDACRRPDQREVRRASIVRARCATGLSIISPFTAATPCSPASRQAASTASAQATSVSLGANAALRRRLAPDGCKKHRSAPSPGRLAPRRKTHRARGSSRSNPGRPIAIWPRAHAVNAIN